MSELDLLARIDERLDRLERQLADAAAPPVYDYQALRRMGVPKHRARTILRSHGTGTGDHGRRLITRTALERALDGDPPPTASAT